MSISTEAFSSHTAWICLAAGVMFAAGAVVDVAILWGFQRVPDNAAWEFTALATTVEGLPRVALGCALVAVGLWLSGSTSLIAYRGLGLFVLMTGFAGAAAAALVVTDWFVIRGDVPAQQAGIFQGIVAKSIALGGIYILLFIPAGVLSMRRPRR
jgi:hypothetical protein